MTEYAGTVGSPGLAIGKVYIYKPFVPSGVKNSILDSETNENLSLFERSIVTAKSELEQLQKKYAGLNSEKCEILRTHQVILEDEEVYEGIKHAIIDEHKCAPWAVQDTYDKYIKILMDIDDTLIRERVSDMQDVHNRIQRCMQNIPETTLRDFDEPYIVVTDDLLPSDAVSLDPAFVLGIVTERGGTTSHTAIIAKSHGIPAILGIKNACSVFHSGQEIVVDAVKGSVLAELTDEEKMPYTEKLASYNKNRLEAQSFLFKDARTKDNIKIEVKVNIGSSAPKELASAGFSDGVGLFRSEFLYMESDSLPDEEVQFKAYKAVLEAFGSKPVILRTLDIGGDKKLPYMDLPHEDNPFLGKRALRLCLERKDLFRTQLRAALRASNYGNLWIMFPMVSAIEEIKEALAIAKEVSVELDRDGITYSPDVKYGIMIEIPSVALISDHVAELVDFASVGTNDLCQYLTATDRMNPELKRYYQPYHPAMFRLLKYVVRSFSERGKSVSICGEAGGDPSFVIPLIGFGMRSFSMSASGVAGMKHMLSGLDMKTAGKAAEEVLQMSDAQEIKQYLQKMSENLIAG